MEKAKYLPEEIERMIHEEISLIEASNSRADADAIQRRRGKPRSPLRRVLDFFRSLSRSQ